MIAGCRNCAHTVSLEVGDRVPHSCPACGLDWQTVTTAPVGSDWFALVPYPANVLPKVACDFEFGPLARYLDTHPEANTNTRIMRHDGKWVIRVESAIGFGHSLAEAAACVCNSLFARAELPTIPEKG